ncbi:hypothetical protein ZOSMA_99G00090 [Zostera marina]|uniref:Hydroxyproline-rich glycoprotein family protein n=1 Tax=Zostera marina TaxID=29655 RepID=A0A0K9NH53_ZOSMR|nr:hypothetical protein ZOSMA_99G00090 [Zostera marina]
MADGVEFVDLTAHRPQHNPIRLFSGFLFKSAFIGLLVFLLSLFPSQAPEFFNQSVTTRGWELIHLLLVGIAVSYGLFSRRNSDPFDEKEGFQRKNIVNHSYVSQVLEVGSVFDDEEEERQVSASVGPMVVEGSMTQMWNSKYYREEPTVVVATERSDEIGPVTNPLRLPVRSLKSKVSDLEPVHVSNSRSVDTDDLGLSKSPRTKPTDYDNVVLPSPIPWRSRSGRMDEMKGESYPLTSSGNSPIPEYLSLSSPATSVRSRSIHSRRTRRASPSPSVSPSPELIFNPNGEDFLKKTVSFHKHSPPPAPPPPPPPPPQHYSGNRSALGSVHVTSKRSFKDELKYMSRTAYKETKQPAPSPPPPPPTTKIQSSSNPLPPPPPSTTKIHSSSNPLPPLPPPLKNEKRGSFGRKFIIESNSDNESDSDRTSSISSGNGDDRRRDRLEEEEEEESSNSVVEEHVADSNEVDKKADEFIAKFREQIRLQRIESIKKSTVQKRGSRTSIRKTPKE